MNTIKRIAAALFLLTMLAQSSAWADSVGDLLSNSPFIPQGWTPGGMRKEAAQNSTYQFKGVYSIGSDTFINILSDGKSRWIQIGSSKDGINANSYDRERNEVSITAGGKNHTLKIEKPAVTSKPVALAVNSAKNTPSAKTNNGIRPKSRRNMRPLPPPPGWEKFKNSRTPRSTRTKVFSTSSGGGSSSSSSSSSNSDSSSSSGSSDNASSSDSGSNDSSSPGYDPSSGDDDTGSGGDDDTSSFSPPPPPPDFVPSIPAELQEMIDSGDSPDTP